MRWWGLFQLKYQLNGRICLTNCIFFGLGCVLLCHVVNPPLLRWLMGIGPGTPCRWRPFIFGLYIMDNVLSIRSAFQLSHRLDKLQKIQQEIRQHLDEKAQLYGNRVGAYQPPDERAWRRPATVSAGADAAPGPAAQRCDMFERRLLRSPPTCAPSATAASSSTCCGRRRTIRLKKFQ